jgi:hypothetical protein
MFGNVAAFELGSKIINIFQTAYPEQSFRVIVIDNSGLEGVRLKWVKFQVGFTRKAKQ